MEIGRTEGKVEVSSSDPMVSAIVKSLQSNLAAALDGLGLKDEPRSMTTAVALTRFVWEQGQTDPQIPPAVTKFLLQIAIDAGMAEQIGLLQLPDKGATLQ
jgi:hypothetical protein